MLVRSVSVVLLTAWLGARGDVRAETESSRTDGGAAEETSPLEDFSLGDFRLASDSSPDLRPGRMANGVLEQPGGLYAALGVGMFAVAGADLASTELGSSRPGIYEANPFQGNRSVRIATHVAAPALMYWVTDRLQKSGRPKLALLARLGFNVAYSYAVMHNLRSGAAP